VTQQAAHTLIDAYFARFRAFIDKTLEVRASTDLITATDDRDNTDSRMVARQGFGRG
jgi:hypothetical protein